MENLPIVIKRIASARSLRARITDKGEVVITAPRLLPQRYIDNFISEHADWIAEKYDKARQQQTALTEVRQTLLLRGKEYSFRLEVSSSKKGVKVTDGRIVVTAPSEDHNMVRSLLEKFFRKEAEKYLKPRVELLCDLVGKEIKTISVRSQRTRWGSCSSRLSISLNWRLIMAPDFASDYVIYHELAHLTHMNHSKRFWDLVADYIPNYKEAEKWLKQHHELLKF